MKTRITLACYALKLNRTAVVRHNYLNTFAVQITAKIKKKKADQNPKFTAKITNLAALRPNSAESNWRPGWASCCLLHTICLL